MDVSNIEKIFIEKLITNDIELNQNEHKRS